MSILSDITKALHSASKVIYKEEERARKSNKYHAPREYQYSLRITIKEVVFEAIPEAVRIATGNGQYPVSARNLYYQIRPLIEDSMSGKELDYRYFSQTLLTEYQKRYGPIEELYYDPRGVLYEPHSGKSIQLGTREVADYEFPSWLYNKILYIEKKGLWPILKSAKIAEKFDLAVIAAEGYATEAARVLFKNAQKDQNYELYVLHDADPYGYNIARTLQEETERMPDYTVNVIDLGLFLHDGLNMGLQTETFIRSKELPWRLELSDIEEEYFYGEKQSWKKWKCKRIELNALSAPQLIQYIEDKLTKAGAAGKVIPPDDKLREYSDEFYRDEINDWVDETLNEIMLLDDIKSSIASEFIESVQLKNAKDCINKGFEDNPYLSWNKIVQHELRSTIYEINSDLTKALQLKIHESLDKK